MVLTERLPVSVQARSFVFLLLTLTLVSAAWIESDAYRYSALVLFLFGMYSYVRSDPKPVLGWMYFLCVGWSLYVLFRMAADYEMSGGANIGTSEGIYLFPAAYATIAYPLARRRAVVERCVWLFMAISFAALLVTVSDLAVFKSG